MREAKASNVEHTAFLETLECRIAPAILASVEDGTLTITGDAGHNFITIAADAEDATSFQISSVLDTINGVGGALSFSGITNIVIRLGDGSDRVFFEESHPLALAGDLVVDLGSGVNSMVAGNLSVAGDFLIEAAGRKSDATVLCLLTDVAVGGDLEVHAGKGMSGLTIGRSEFGESSIGGDLIVKSKSRQDGVEIQINDTGIGGDVDVRCGVPSSFALFDEYSERSSIGGDLRLSGMKSVRFETAVLGDAKIGFGKEGGVFQVGGQNDLPAYVAGSLKIRTLSPEAEHASFQFDMAENKNQTGLVIGKDVKILTKNRSDSISLHEIEVGGKTVLSLGGRGSFVSILGAEFGGRFMMKGGSGVDWLHIDQSGDENYERSTFHSHINVHLGSGTEAGDTRPERDSFKYLAGVFFPTIMEGRMIVKGAEI